MKKRPVVCAILKNESNVHKIKRIKTKILEGKNLWVRDDIQCRMRTINLLVLLLRDQDREVRMRASEYLGQLGKCSWGVMKALINTLKNDSDPLVRLCSAESLGRLNCRGSEQYLIRALKDPNFLVRGYAASSLADIGSKTAKKSIWQVLHRERFSWAKASYYFALYRLGERNLLSKLLEESLFSRNYRTRVVTANGLTDIADTLDQADFTPVFNSLQKAFAKETTIAGREAIRRSIHVYKKKRNH